MTGLDAEDEGDGVHARIGSVSIYRLGLGCGVRIGLAGAIRADDGGEVGVTKEQCVVTLVGLEV